MTDQMTLPVTDQMGTFPSREHHAALRQRFRQDGTKIFSSDDRFHWHAYDYGWRRVMLGDQRHISPIDPTGEWFNEFLANGAEAFWRAKMGKQRLPRAVPSDPGAERADWRRIPFQSLTEAEKELFNESVARMHAAGRFGTPQIRRMPGPAPKPTHVARELTGFSLEPDDSQMDAAE